MEKVVLVGRVKDKSKLVGGKFINLNTLIPVFISTEEFNSYFNTHEVVNAAYNMKGLRITKKHYSYRFLAIYKRNLSLRKSGVYTESELIAMEWHVNPDIVRVKICKALAFCGITNPYCDEANERAELYYDEIRKMSSDIKMIAENTGLSERIILDIKNYLFMVPQFINGEYGFFETDFSIAQSWQRLMSKDKNDIKPHDISLIRHRLLEMELVNKGMSYVEAHKKAMLQYDYIKESAEYYRGLVEDKEQA